MGLIQQLTAAAIFSNDITKSVSKNCCSVQLLTSVLLVIRQNLDRPATILRLTCASRP
jgi:hypothetical protein